jgi:hypothetical protein
MGLNPVEPARCSAERAIVPMAYEPGIKPRIGAIER